MKKTTALMFDHRNRTKEGRPGPVEIRVTVGRHSYYFATGVKVRRSEFVAGRVVNCPGADGLNERIAAIYEKVMMLVKESISNGTAIDTEMVKRRVWETRELTGAGDTLLTWIDQQIPLLAVSEGTRQHYRAMLDRLREFGRMRRWEDVTVENICLFDGWLHSLRNVMAGRRRVARLSDAGVYNHHKCLKALLNRADRFGKINRNPYERLRGQFRRGDAENTEYLTDEEIQAILDLQLPKGSLLERSADLFIFQMFTGLAYSDAQAFDFSKYRKVSGRWQFTGRRIKTGVPYVSELLPPAVNVLEKYGGRVPHIDNADYNHQLKAIAVIAGIDVRLHSHLARHTFATMMLRCGAKIENVSRMLGHTNIQQTQRYAKTLAQSVHEDFEAVRGKLPCGSHGS